MKKVVFLLSLVLAAAFAMAPMAYATKNYNSSLSNKTAVNLCGGIRCQGDIQGGKLYLIGRR